MYGYTQSSGKKITCKEENPGCGTFYDGAVFTVSAGVFKRRHIYTMDEMIQRDRENKKKKDKMQLLSKRVTSIHIHFS